MNVAKYMRLSSMNLKNQRIASKIKTLNNPSLRVFSTEMNNYFKRVLKSETPETETPNSFERDQEITYQHLEFKRQRAEEISKQNEYREILGMKDYEMKDYRYQGALNDVPDYKGIIQGKIPQDKIEANRYELEIVNNLNPRHEIAVFNIPFDVKKEEIITIFDKHGVVDNIELHNSVLGLPCYATITYKQQDSLEKCMKSPNEIWIKGNLLRLRTTEHSVEESLKNRTIAVSKIPKWATETDIAKHLSHLGAVIYIDMPKTDARIEQIRRNVPNIENESKIQNTYEERLQVADSLFKRLYFSQNPEINFEQDIRDFGSQIENPSEQTTLAEKILNFDKDLYKEKVMSKVSQAPPSDLSVLNNEKRIKILTLCTMVYNENQLVNNSIKDLKAERDNYVNRLNNVMEYSEVPGRKDADSFITAEQIQTLKSYLSYVDKNHDSLPPEIISEVRENKAFQAIRDYHIERSGEIPSDSRVLKETLEARISKSQENVHKELASGYQWLLQSLERREEILKHRLDRLLADYGKEDRVLVSDKDFKNELEDIKFREYGEGPDTLKLEDIISISEQMRNITEWKKPKTFEELEKRRQYESLFQAGTPNFGDYDINFSEVTPRTVDLIMKRKIDQEGNFNMNTLHSAIPNRYDPQILKKIMRKVNQVREELDTPFDEMYHKEKALIDNVAKAEKELLESQEAADASLQETNRSIEHLFDNNTIGLFEQEDDLRVLLKKQTSYDDSADSLFSERTSLTKNYQDLVMEMIGDKDIDKYLDQQGNIENMGYCFATFSHTDEAKKAMMVADEFRIDTTTRSHRHLMDSFGKSDLYMKNDMSHEDFNIEYLKQRTLSDANILDQKQNLRKAKKKLRMYEDTIEQQMPKTARLKKMKEAAKDAIDENLFFDRNAFPRSKLEEEQLEQKIKDMEKRTGMDFAPLLDSEKKEKERIQRHKKAFETYKSYSFLKAGLKKTELEKQLTNDNREVSSQHNFPSPDEVVSTFINKDFKFSMLKEGEENRAPGRKFKFTPQEYVEKYFGKDYLSNQEIEVTDRPMYSFNDEMKRTYSYAAVSDDNITSLERKQELVAKHAMERFQLSPDEMPVEWREQKVLDKKNTDSVSKTFMEDEVIVDNPLHDKPWEERRKQFVDKLHRKKSVFTEDHWGRREIQRFYKEEYVNLPDIDFEKRIRKLEREIEEGEKEAEEKEAAGKEGTGEKWKPSYKQRAKDQDSREKVYSDYLDKEKIDAIKEGDYTKYKNVERDFLKKYKKVALDPNLDSTDGVPYKSENTDEDYAFDIAMERNYKNEKTQDIKYATKIRRRQEGLREIDELAHEKKALKYREPREDMRKIYDQNKSSIREVNEEFFYRQEYAKGNPKLKDAIDRDETLMTKLFRNATQEDITLDRELRANKDAWAISDRKLGTDFSENLSKGDVVKGLLKRKEQLKEGHYRKDLSEIAGGSDQDSKDLYREYINYEASGIQVDKEAEISERERKFLEAVEKDYEKTSPSAQKTFQDYEDYKRRIQAEQSEYENVNDPTEVDDDLSTRDWYSKIWTGKITNQEFGDYMFDQAKTKDKLGYDKTIHYQKRNPGYGKKDFLTQEDRKRIAREIYEIKRRNSVMQGLCTETDSHEYMENIMESYKKVEQAMRKPAIRRNLDEYMEIFKVVTAGEQVREYYFDPKQGVSLDQHLESVKKVYPNAKIESYLDDDGFTVVKRTSEVEYKYNLNDLLNYAPSEVESKYHRGVKRMIDDNKVNIKNEEDLVRFLEDPGYKKSDIYQELMTIQERYGDIVDDIDTFKSEMREQIEIKKLRYKYFKKLQPEDFVKSQIPEKVAMEKLKESYEQRILNYEGEFAESDRNRDYLDSLKGDRKMYDDERVDPEINVLNKHQYKELRQKLKDTKEAKARLLKQGFPTLENYVYL